MRIATLVTYPLLLGALAACATGASGQYGVSGQLGPEIGLYAYSQQQYGDWRTDYAQWRPVTLYSVNGVYYQRSMRGARPVQVYSRGNEYFLPPQDQAWVGHDRRYNYKHRPTADDYGRARPHN
jgi:hypothetical protein